MLTTNLGMDKMHGAMAVYVKSLSKRAEGADKEKQLPGGHLGSSMVTHGEDFEPDSEFGNCLSCMSATNWTLLHVTDDYSPGSSQRAPRTRTGDVYPICYVIMAGGSRAFPNPDEGVPGTRRPQCY
jgi:hypothetical protein